MGSTLKIINPNGTTTVTKITPAQRAVLIAAHNAYMAETERKGRSLPPKSEVYANDNAPAPNFDIPIEERIPYNFYRDMLAKPSIYQPTVQRLEQITGFQNEGSTISSRFGSDTLPIPQPELVAVAGYGPVGNAVTVLTYKTTNSYIDPYPPGPENAALVRGAAG